MRFSLRKSARELRRKRDGRSVVLAAGTFDVLHPGHLRYLERCKREGDLLVVCVSGDIRTRRRKGAGRPVMPATQRAQLVASLRVVDTVFISDRKPFTETILEAIEPNIVVTSRNEPSEAVKDRFLEHMRKRHPEIMVKLIHKSDSTLSSSRLIKKLKG